MPPADPVVEALSGRWLVEESGVIVGSSILMFAVDMAKGYSEKGIYMAGRV